MTEPAGGGARPPRAPERSASHAVLGRGSVYTIATAAPALAAVAVTPVVTRVLTVPEYDLVAVATVLIQVGFIFAALGMGAAITRQYILAAAGAAGARGLVAQSAVLATVVVGLAAGTAAWWSSPLLGRPASPEIYLALAACLGGAWVVEAQAFLRGSDEALAFVSLALVSSLLGPVAGLVAVLSGHASAVTYLSGVAAGFLAAGAIGLWRVLRSGEVRASRSGLGQAVRIGLPTVPHQVSLYIALAGLVIIADRALASGGRANIALTIGAGATVITAAMNNAWAPLVYRRPAHERGAVLTETTRTIATMTVTVAGLVALGAPWILRLAAPGSFDPDSLVPAVALASAAAVPSVIYLASGHLVFASGRTGWLAVTTPLAVAAGLVWAVSWSSRWGLTAVASGYLVVYLLLALATTLLQRAVSRPPWRPPLLPVVLATWVAVTVLAQVLPTVGPGSLLRVLAGAVLASGGTWAVRRHLSGAVAAQPIR